MFAHNYETTEYETAMRHIGSWFCRKRYFHVLTKKDTYSL